MVTPQRTSALIEAAVRGDLDRVRELVSSGSDVNESDQFGWLPIHRAAANNRDAVIAYLVAQGSAFEARGTDQWTPLHLACVSGSSRAVVALLEAGADAKSIARDHNTPLHLALTPLIDLEFPELHGDSVRTVTGTVQALLGAGANPSARNIRGETPAAIARRKGALDLATFLETAASGKVSPPQE
jgi:ankyrin repeat protein